MAQQCALGKARRLAVACRNTALGTLTWNCNATANRSTGLKILGLSFDDPCATAPPLPGTPAADLAIRAIFDGWGYVHLYDATTFEVIDHWALPEAIDPAFARDHGVLSVHEVATDPRRNRAYVSHYSGGFRVLDFGRGGIKEVGAYIHPLGNNFWGVEVHYMPAASDPIVLASDRDSGLWIFRYKPGGGKGGGKKSP